MTYHLAQINVAKFRLPENDPINDDFNNAIDRVNALGEAQDGFVWRYISGADENPGLDVFGDGNIIVNMTVWRDLEALTQFVYRTPGHLEIMRRRKEWFERLETPMAIWWIKAGEIPSVEEGKRRLEMLATRGPSAEAFLFSKPFASPDGDEIEAVKDKCA